MSARTAAALREHATELGPAPAEIPVGKLWVMDFFGQLGFLRADKFARITPDVVELSSDELVTFALEKPDGAAQTGILTFHEKAGNRRILRYRVLGIDPNRPSDVIAERLFDAT